MKILTVDGEFEFDEGLVAGFSAKYPHVDFRREVSLAYLWTWKNVSRRPRNAVRFMENWLKKRKPELQKMHVVQGKMSESDMLAKGREIGISPRPGEDWVSFGRRLRASRAA